VVRTRLSRPLFGRGDRRTFEHTPPTERMSDTDLLGVVLGAIAILMFATGLFLAI
jgi:hypothetical protein